ncbi:MAG: PAS domain-containing protein, partial [Candidatus Aegiribacteria sp.]|nr:PAS domain-containing protein [Candidatus Aegiribacteria sp.]
MGSGDMDQEFMYRAIDTSMHAVVFCDLDLNIEWVNGEFLRKFDLEDIGAAKGKSIISMLNNPDSIAGPMLELLETGRWQGELQFQLSDGSTIDTLVNAAILPDASGAPRRIIASGMDITRKKLAENVLRESEDRYRVLFNTAMDSIFIKNRYLRYTQVNPAMKQLFELPTSELIGKTDEDLFGSESFAHIRETDYRVLGGESIEE